jgi:hypothetical protein
VSREALESKGLASQDQRALPRNGFDYGYVVFSEMIPESHSRGYYREATFGATFGFLLMIVLDHLFV